MTAVESAPVRRYRIQHRTTYRYSDDVSVSFGRAFLTPRTLPHQRCLDHRVSVDPDPSDHSTGVDVHGNRATYFSVTSAYTRLEVTGTSTVEVSDPVRDPAVESAPWEAARPAGVDPLAVEYCLDSPLVEVDDAVRRYAGATFLPGRPLGEAVDELTHRIHSDFRYDPRASSVTSNVPDLLASRAGVCQDFAHLAVACLRSVGLAGRYVSGYLATTPPPGRERMVGVDASHAWAAVRGPDGSWLAFDPTNDHRAGDRYTTVAWGRDYGDVSPLRGVLFTHAEKSEMTVSVDVAPE
ncbi:transglutaminase family protein [Nakamurella flavida]|uniref:Transglutaminase family protein n=1 Tax=Nakamurella flavida TaxID=363630 RepID=A0A938YQ14_9ACTN|nr:transglutaminase family protein [Nakamurella flavida]MBM9477372.1 transglutaminase family protein [Nakamurella flavida]MDP9777304.1 transglutaminase-like putative cysteine protease [Nakamurella flavida]